jgi:hypothetical protein
MSQRYSPHPDPRNARGRARQPDRLPDTDPYMPRPGRSVARPHETAPPQKVKARSEFTFHHAGKRVRIGPVAFWTLVGTLVIMAGWSIVTATYFAFHDDVLARLIAHEAAMQFAYEDRIAELRMQVDRMASRQLLNRSNSSKSSSNCYIDNRSLNRAPRRSARLPIRRRPAPSRRRRAAIIPQSRRFRPSRHRSMQ